MKRADEFLLSHDHADVDDLLNEAIDKIASGGVADAFRSLDLFWARLAMHIRAEHLHLFPALQILYDGVEAVETLERLRLDHDYFMHVLADLTKAMRSITSANELEVRRLTADSLRAIRSRLADHNAIEEVRIYPLYKLMSAGDSEQLSRSIAKELNNLPPRLVKRL